MKKVWILVILVLVAIFGGRLYYLNKNKADNTNTIKLALLSDLSGFSSRSGQDAVVGVKNAINDINNNQNYGFKIQLSVQDHKFLAKDSINAFKKVQSEGVDGLIIMGSVPVFALYPLIDENKIPTIVTSASDTDIPTLSPWLYRGWIYVKPQANLLATFIKNDLHLDNVAIFKIKNQFGDDYEHNFTSAFKKLNGNVLLTESFDISSIDVKSQVAKIISKQPPAVVVFGFEQGVATAIDTLQELGYKGAILTTPDAILDYKTWKGKGENVYFTSTNWDFLNPNNTMNIHSMFAYIDTMLFAEAVKQGGKDPENIRKALLNIKDFDSVFGKIGYNENRELIFPKLIIKQMQADGTAKIVKE